MTIKNFEDLRIWKLAHIIVKEIYILSKEFPKEERFELSSQLKRAAVSVPANIAEGFERQHTKEFMQFLNIAKGSLSEVRYYLILAKDLNYISKDKYEKLNNDCKELLKMIGSLINKLKQKLNN